MTSLLKKVCRPALDDIANQHACAVRSIAGSIVSRINAKRTRHVKKAAVDAIGVAPDDCVLEIGYGRGHGLSLVYEKVREGKGVAFGIETSEYLKEVTRKRFILEIAEEKNVRLDSVLYLSNLPFPSDFFAGVFHVDSFYYWRDLYDVCVDLLRVLRPGGLLVCGMQLSRLRRLAKWNIINEALFNPNRYLLLLEPVGFVDVKMEYHKEPGVDEFQLITARKPLASKDYYDPEERMKKLEMDIKKELLAIRMLKEQRPVNESLDDFPMTNDPPK